MLHQKIGNHISGFTPAQVEIFSADRSTDLQYSAASSTVICLAMENAVIHARSLCQAFILELKQLALYGRYIIVVL